MREDFECPITSEIFSDPVIACEEGHTFEREAIEKVRASEGNCPSCRSPLNSKFIPNLMLRNMIASYLKDNPSKCVEQYLSLQLKQEAIEAVKRDNSAQLRALLEKEPRLLTVDLNDDISLMGFALKHWSRESFKLIADRLGKESEEEITKVSVKGISTELLDVLFIEACQSSDKVQLETLFSLGANINAVDPKGMTALHYACQMGDDDCTSFLLSLPSIAIDVQDDLNMSPLLLTALHGHLKLFHQLLDFGASIDLQNSECMNALQLAVKGNYSDLINDIIENSRVHFEKSELFNRDSLLYIAIAANAADALSCLIQHGMNIAVVDKDGLNPLHFAATRNSDDCIACLVGNGLRIDSKVERTKSAPFTFPRLEGKTPLHLALLNQANETVVRLIKMGADIGEILEFTGDSLLHVAVAAGNLFGVKQLLASGIPVDLRNKRGAQPIHFCRNAKILDCLIANGASINAQDKSGKTPYMYLISYYGEGSKTLFALFLSRGADPLLQDKLGWTVLHYSAQAYGKIDVVRLLLEQHPELMAMTTHKKETVLHVIRKRTVSLYAEKKKIKDYIAVLLEYGFDIEALDGNDETPLVVSAIKAKDAMVVNCLLESGADINHCIAKGQSPIYVAVSYLASIHYRDSRETFKQILQHCLQRSDIDFSLVSEGGYSAFHLACLKGCSEAVSCFIESGAPITLKSARDDTLLDFAIRGKSLSMVKQLVQAGIDIQQHGSGAYTALHWAAHFNAEDILLYLLSKGANPLAKSDRGYTPLHCAVLKNAVDAITVLLQHQPDLINQQAGGGETPLALALALDDSTVLTSLLVGAEGVIDFTKQDDKGYPILTLAVRSGILADMKQLVSAGAELTIIDKMVITSSSMRWRAMKSTPYGG